MATETSERRWGGPRKGAGNIKDDVRTITLDDDMRMMLNIIVRHARMLRGDKVSHKQIVKELIEARWSELDDQYQAEANNEET